MSPHVKRVLKSSTILLFMLRLEASIPTVVGRLVGWSVGRLVGLQNFFEKVCNTKKGFL